MLPPSVPVEPIKLPPPIEDEWGAKLEPRLKPPPLGAYHTRTNTHKRERERPVTL
jgi:hypothetical protein